MATNNGTDFYIDRAGDSDGACSMGKNEKRKELDDEHTRSNIWEKRTERGTAYQGARTEKEAAERKAAKVPPEGRQDRNQARLEMPRNLRSQNPDAAGILRRPQTIHPRDRTPESEDATCEKRLTY